MCRGQRMTYHVTHLTSRAMTCSDDLASYSPPPVVKCTLIKHCGISKRCSFLKYAQIYIVCHFVMAHCQHLQAYRINCVVRNVTPRRYFYHIYISVAWPPYSSTINISFVWYFRKYRFFVRGCSARIIHLVWMLNHFNVSLFTHTVPSYPNLEYLTCWI